ncbi:MAG: VTT domain-containing protein [Candidatus Bathyarchaeales archaeon]
MLKTGKKTFPYFGATAEKGREKFSGAFKVSWIRSSIFLGIILLAIGLMVILILKILNVGGTTLFIDAKSFVKEYGLIGIFFATILAGTIVPLGSPALVVAAASFGAQPIPLILTATVGFTVGMTINYVVAYSLGRPYVMKKVGVAKLEEISALWNRWGWVIYTVFGLVPFLPVELLSLFCGLIKTRIDVFLILSFTPRLVVFAILTYFGGQIGGWIGII